MDNSVEHKDVKVVAVNDPFIEPHYAVSSLAASVPTIVTASLEATR